MGLWLVICAVLLAGGVAFFWYQDREQDRILDLAFLSLQTEAKAKLSSDDIERLTLQLREQLDIVKDMIAQGVPPKKASRMGKRAAIQTIASFIEIERMFSQGNSKAA